MNKTCLVTTSWLDEPVYYARTVKFINHYKKHFDVKDIYIIENGSINAPADIQGVKVMTQYPHYKRTAHLEYLFVWRAVYSLKYFFDMGYDRVVYANNDFFCLSDNMFKWIEGVKGWESPWCQKHNFPEADIMVVTKDCQVYKDFVADGYFWKYNAMHLETVVPITVNRTLVGDRYAEYPKDIPPDADFCAQVPLDWIIR